MMNKKEMLSKECLENVNGGYVVSGWGMEGFHEEAPWQAIDDKTGKTLKHCTSYSDAVVAAEVYNVSTELVSQDFVKELRKNHAAAN